MEIIITTNLIFKLDRYKWMIIVKYLMIEIVSSGAELMIEMSVVKKIAGIF